MSTIDSPFHRVAIALIGPITPGSDKINGDILTIVDYASRYAEAIVLPKIQAERVAEAIFETFVRVGYPTETLSDRGSQFTS